MSNLAGALQIHPSYPPLLWKPCEVITVFSGQYAQCHYQHGFLKINKYSHVIKPDNAEILKINEKIYYSINTKRWCHEEANIKVEV